MMRTVSNRASEIAITPPTTAPMITTSWVPALFTGPEEDGPWLVGDTGGVEGGADEGGAVVGRAVGGGAVEGGVAVGGK